MQDNRSKYYRDLFEKMTSGFAVHEIIYNDDSKAIDYLFLEVNPTYEEITGLRSETVIGRTVKEIIPDLEDFWIERYSNIFITNKDISFIDYSKALNKYFQVKAFKLDEKRFGVIVNDVTEIQENNKELIESRVKVLESETKFRLLLESSGYIFIYIDIYKNIQTFNHRASEFFLSITGKPIQSNSSINELFDLLNLDKTIIDKAFHGQVFYKEVFHKLKNEKLNLEITLKPIFNENNIIEALSFIAYDITLKKQINQELLYNEERLKTILEILPVGIVITNDLGRFVYVNLAASKMLNFNLNTPITDFNNPKNWKFVDNNYDIIPRPDYPSYRSLKFGETILNMEMGLLNQDDTFTWLNVSSAPIPIPGYGVVLAFKDITESVIANETNKRLIQDLYESRMSIEENAGQIMRLNYELEARAEELKKLNYTKDKFFSIISHDLRNPLGGFMQITELLVNDMFKMPIIEIQDVLTELHSSADNIYKLLNNLLDWSKTQTGKVDFNPSSLSLKYLVDNTIDLVKINVLNKNITLLTDIDDSINIFADARMVLTVIRNLVTNSIKYTKRGGYINIIAFKDESTPEVATICIEDSGIGIPEEDLPKLFELSSQKGRPGTDNEPSTGLGLILCQEFVNKNGGLIWAESTQDKGSKFFFTLPLAQE